jgi:hypothetical protein
MYCSIARVIKQQTFEAAADQGPDKDGDQSHGCRGFCCVDGQISVLQSETHSAINTPRALKHELPMQSTSSMETPYLRTDDETVNATQ